MMKSLTLRRLNVYPEYVDTDIPSVRDGQILLAVQASALNHRDVWITKGQYPGIELPVILGSDGVGLYEGRSYIINPGIQWGDNAAVQSRFFRVLGLPDNGTFAEYVAIAKSQLYEAPAHLSRAEAAALPLAGVTAYRALVVKCRPQPGERVLITGIGGGVALFVMQFAVALGAKVFVTSGTDQKIDKARLMGAVDGANYNNANWHKRLKDMSGGFDVVIDSAGGPGFGALINLCRPGARMAMYGGTLGNISNISPQILFWKQISLFGSTMGSPADFQAMLDLVDVHKIRPVVDSVFPMADGAKAFERMDRGLQFGKIVLDHTS